MSGWAGFRNPHGVLHPLLFVLWSMSNRFVIDVDRLIALDAELRDGRNQPGRKVRRMPHHQMMIPDRLMSIDLLLRKKSLPDRFHRIFMK